MGERGRIVMWTVEVKVLEITGKTRVANIVKPKVLQHATV